MQRAGGAVWPTRCAQCPEQRRPGHGRDQRLPNRERFRHSRDEISLQRAEKQSEKFRVESGARPAGGIAGRQRAQLGQRHPGAAEQRPQPQHVGRRVPHAARLAQEQQVRGEEGLRRLQAEGRHHSEAVRCPSTAPVHASPAPCSGHRPSMVARVFSISFSVCVVGASVPSFVEIPVNVSFKLYVTCFLS
ncbi:hypothetical protein FOCC_FOCC002739 [Frankliniella occidentalis]|nr:hypothetical protein FOCC_FOCC002739 [Frankliniella occidentalis]